MQKKLKSKEIELDREGEKVSELSIVVTTVNNYFKEKVVKLRPDLDVSVEDSLSYTDEYLLDKTVNELEFKHVSLTCVRGIILNLTNTGALLAHGVDWPLLGDTARLLQSEVCEHGADRAGHNCTEPTKQRQNSCPSYHGYQHWV